MRKRVHYDVRDLASLPRRLRNAGLPALTLAGAPLEAERVVAIVGTRDASPIMAEATRWLAGVFVREGWVVASGGADGIDAVAHKGALSAGGVTWAVLPSGCEETFPAHHKGLFERIADEGGTLLWPFAPRQLPLPKNFHARNRVLVAISDAVVIVESPHRSGTRSTARFARAAKKPVWVLPEVPWADCGGNGDEIRLGGRPLRRMNEFFESFQTLEAPHPLFARLGPTQNGETSAEDRLLRCLGEEPKHPDDLVRESGLKFAEVSRALLTLSLDTVVVVGPDGRYRRCQ